MWLHFFQVGERRLEWGFDGAELQAIPAVGDFVWLNCGLPDKPYEEAFRGKIASREWVMDGDDIEVCFEVELETSIPAQYEADSPIWPLEEFSKRKAEVERFLSRKKT
jgi:hypothetical protein